MRDTRPAKRKKKVMTVGIQTRAMTEAQRIEDKAQRNLGDNQKGVQVANPTPGQAALDPTMNPTVESSAQK